jgi:hypothetical protein
MAIYKTALGKEIDMGKLVQKNELVPAVGNARVNARGDKLGAGGKIIQRREELQTAANQIPDQINVRQAPPAPVVEEQLKPVPPAQKAKNIKDMDPEGNE